MGAPGALRISEDAHKYALAPAHSEMVRSTAIQIHISLQSSPDFRFLEITPS